MLSAGLYKVALKKLTPPRLRAFAVGIQYGSYNLSASLSYTFLDAMRRWDAIEILGMKFTGIRLFVFSTWIALAIALVIAIVVLRDHTIVDATDPEPESAGITLPTHDINGKPLSEELEAEPVSLTGTRQAGLAGLRQWRRQATRRYRVVQTPLLSDGTLAKLKLIAKEQGYSEAGREMVVSACRQFREVAAMRNLWMVISFSLTTFFVSKQWGDMDSMSVPHLTRMFGEEAPGVLINSINTWMCMFLAPTIAAFTGPKEAFKVMMPGLWIMAAAPIFWVLEPSVASAALWIIALTLGEVLWSPRQSAWSATVAPVGREGVFIAVSSLKDLLITAPSNAFNGMMNAKFVPNCHDCRNGDHFCGHQFINGSIIGCADQDGEFCPLVKWQTVKAGSTEAPDWCDVLLTCNECQPERLMPAADLYTDGWHQDARTAWLIVLLTSIASPIIAWMILPFLRGEGSKATNFDICKCDIARVSGLCGLGGPSAEEATLLLNPKKVTADELILGDGVGGNDGDGFTVGINPMGAPATKEEVTAL